MRRLRTALVLLLLLAVAVSVGATTALHLSEIDRRLETDIEERADAALRSVRTELQQATEALDAELRLIVEDRGPGLRRLPSATAAERYLWASDRVQASAVGLLKVLDARGRVLSSGHWPASIGAVDPALPTYRGGSGDSPRLLEEPTPRGSVASLQRWRRVELGGEEAWVVVGYLMDEPGLQLIRDRLGVPLLRLCWPAAGNERCLQAAEAELPASLLRRSLDLSPTGTPGRLEVGLDRGPLDGLTAGIRLRAVAVAGAAGLLALLAGFLLARRITRPVEALATASARLAEGELDTRVPPPAAAIAEVVGLVDAFNGMAEGLQSSRERLVQAERVAAWQQVARGLAHELKNPLTPIRGAMDVIRRARALDRPDFDEILDEQARAVVDEVARLKELSDEFARFARLPAARPEPLTLRSIAEHATALYVPDGVAVELIGEAPQLPADRHQLQTALTNLVKNAVEAIDGPGTVRITIAAVDGGQHIDVEDSGPGIDPSVRDELFTPYVTTKGSRGTGLGLALVHRIVVEHGGTIEADDGDLGGARFRIWLPA
jgi:two-component system nitrogen regulation sensor histidine kinase NtrY